VQRDTPHLLRKMGCADFCRNDVFLTAGAHDTQGQCVSEPRLPLPRLSSCSITAGISTLAPCYVRAGGVGWLPSSARSGGRAGHSCCQSLGEMAAFHRLLIFSTENIIFLL